MIQFEDNVATEIITQPGKRLGKLPAKSDPRALLFARFLGREGTPPKRSNFWKRRTPFPMRTFDNTIFGCCTRASQAILAMRMERIETRRTPVITDDEVVRVYFDMTKRLYGGGDTGAYEDDALSEWRRPELTFRDTKGRPLTIDAYTKINHADQDELRWAIHFSGAKGIKVCFDLPEFWSDIDPPGIWDVGPDFLNDRMPGSWGGHSLSADRFDETGVGVVHTWYEKGHAVQDEQTVTWKAVAAYCSEAYLVIDSVDAWRKKLTKRALDLSGIVAAVNRVSSHRIEV